MSVRPAQRHILKDLKLEHLVYRICLLSPFEILQNQELTTTWRIKLYMCLMLLIYTTFRISFCLQFQDFSVTVQHFSENGKLWMFVDFFDFTFSALSFCCIVLNGFITNTHQIEFFEQLQKFDGILFNSFVIPVRRSRTRTANSCALILGLMYFLGNFLNALANNKYPVLTPYQVFAYNYTYYFDNILNLLSALFYVNCTQLCRERLATVKKLLRNCKNLSSEQMDTVLELYLRIRSQILLINRFMGFVVLLKIVHDFTLGSSVVYLMCSSLYSAKENKEYFTLLLWLGLTVIGSLLLTLAADMLTTEEKEFAEILSSLRIDEMNASKQKWLDNVLLWIRHPAPVLNACGLFPIDLRLLFAMSGGIITYMIVLLQLQDYDDDQSMKSLEFI